MTAKQFFKSTAFKCIVTLFSILLVCGVFLTIMYGFLEVTDEENFARAVQKIYGKSVKTEEIKLDGLKTSFDYSSVDKAYKVLDDGNYLVKVTGKEGFGGSVTCWVVVMMGEDGDSNPSIDGIMKIVIDSAPGESYISKISQGALDSLASKAEYGKELEGGYKHGSQQKGDDYISTGASYSMRAISNCVNGAMEFVAGYALGIVNADFFADNGFEYLEMINNKKTSYTTSDNVVTYSIETTGNSPAGAFTITVKVGEDGVITEYTITEDGSTATDYSDKVFKDYVGKNADWFKSVIGADGTDNSNANYGGNGIQTGATRSNYLCLYAGLFATANYQKALETPYTGGNA